MKRIEPKEQRFSRFITTSLVAMLMTSACGKKAVNKEAIAEQTRTSTFESNNSQSLPSSNENPHSTVQMPYEFLVGYVVYQTELGKHVEGFRLIPKADGLIGTNDVRIASEDVDSIVIQVQIPKSLIFSVGGIQDALLRNEKFEQKVQISDLSFTEVHGAYFVTFMVSGLKYARLPNENIASLQFTFSTTHKRPLKTVQIQCAFRLKLPKKRPFMDAP